jgi:hypothetical protein
LGNELSEDRPWLGSFYLVAMYDRALPLADVLQNYSTGPHGEPVPSAPQITSAAVTAATIGVPYVYDVDAGGYPVPTYGLVTQPAGMTIDAVTGQISWLPTALGDYTVGVAATNSEGSDSQSFTVTVYPDNPMQIVVWHGIDHRVGHLGSAQADFNVLGNVSPVADLASLSYSLNGGSFVNLNIGPDLRRLDAAGDFNADIPILLFQPGANEVVIRAIKTTGKVSTVPVNVTLETGGDQPLPVNVSWSSVADPQDVGQYVDGEWQKDGSGLRAVQEGYDRIFLIGNESWQDYDILVPITINTVYRGRQRGGAPGLGIIMRFTGHLVGGHRDWPNAQPKWGYQPFGGIGWLRWLDGSANDPTMQFYHGDYDIADDFGTTPSLVEDPSTIPFGAEEHTKNFAVADVQAGGTYWMRMRCETQPDAPGGAGVTLYSWKIWQDGTTEPVPWSWQVTQQSQYALREGGVALLAHYVDATFGDVEITPVPPAALAGDINDDGVVDIADAELALRSSVGEIELTATQLERGDLSGDQRSGPLDAYLMLADAEVGIAKAGKQTANLALGSPGCGWGEVTVQADEVTVPLVLNTTGARPRSLWLEAVTPDLGNHLLAVSSELADARLLVWHARGDILQVALTRTVDKSLDDGEPLLVLHLDGAVNLESFEGKISIDGSDVASLARLDIGTSPPRYVLYQNHPNPFNPRTTISFELPRDEYVRVMIHNVQGRVVHELHSGVLPRGSHAFTWDGRDDAGHAVAGGIYFCRLESVGYTASRKMTLVR